MWQLQLILKLSSNLTYGGVTAMDVPGQERIMMTPIGKGPRGNDERRIGQEKLSLKPYSHGGESA